MRKFPSIEEVHEMLDSICEEIPHEFFEGLNEGIVLLPQVKYHPQSMGNDLVILGEYHYSVTGNNIRIYYGSFRRMFPGISEQGLRRKLKDTLLHEFTHHLERRAGQKNLEYADARRMEEYKRRYRNRIKRRNKED